MSTAARNAASDDHQVWLRVFRQEFDHVYRGLRRQGISEADAEDLAQEVFLVMWRRWGQLDQQRPMRPWLAAIAFNLVGNRLRRLHREIPAAEVEVIDDRPGAESCWPGGDCAGSCFVLWQGCRRSIDRCLCCVTWTACRCGRSPLVRHCRCSPHTPG
jgi:hypothetical protein